MSPDEMMLIEQRMRFNQIMRRHIRSTDGELSDDAFKKAVDARYNKEREQPLIDPNE